MSLKEYKATLFEVLHCYEPFDAIETKHLDGLLEFMNISLSPFSKENPEGHITASAILVDSSFSYVLFIWHNKLLRWIQPGGHCEIDVDQTPKETALRELVEEANIKASSITLVQETPFDIDVHVIPAKGKTKSHLHYDLRYLFKLITPVEYSCSSTLKWRGIEELTQLEEESVSRFSKKLLKLKLHTQINHNPD